MTRNLLFLLSTSPLPIASGGQLRMYHVLRALARRDHVITVLSFWREEGERRGLTQLAGELGIDVVTVPFTRLSRSIRTPSGFLQMLVTQVQGRPGDIAIWSQPAMFQALEQALASASIDLIQVEWPYLAPYALAHPHIPRVLVTYDIFSVALSRRAALAANPFSHFWLRRQASVWKRYEASLYGQFAAIGAMSAVDAEIIRHRNAAANPVILPNGVDTTALTPGEIRPLVRNLLFVGSPTHAPNLDAACWLLTAIWPELHRRHPELELTLVNLEHPQVRACLKPGVELLGRVPDLKPIYRQADIAVAPLRAGSGTRLKILEAFALGVPVVSTTIGWEGLTVTPGKHLLSADDAQDFVEAIEHLIGYPHERERLVRQARALVVEHYDWSHIAQLHETMYESVLALR
ncbi:MAG TPA: glycosyltransferase [Caldilineae bacterium]|nr:glycosyltransferase [Caldilineae bacterium]